jgi:hypothetical protein
LIAALIEVRLMCVGAGPTLDYADAAEFLAGFETMIEKVRRRRLQYPPLAAPSDPASFAISDVDIALLMRAAGKAPGEAAAWPVSDVAAGG